MDQWLYGPVAVWTSGCMDQWLCKHRINNIYFTAHAHYDIIGVHMLLKQPELVIAQHSACTLNVVLLYA